MDSVPASPVMASSRLFAVFSFQGLMKHHLQICLVAQASPLGLRACAGEIGRVNSYRHRRGRATLLSLFEDSREGRRTALGCRARQPRCRLLAMVKPPLRFFRLFSALEKQLGLTLRKIKDVPVDAPVVEQVERIPTGKPTWIKVPPNYPSVAGGILRRISSLTSYAKRRALLASLNCGSRQSSAYRTSTAYGFSSTMSSVRTDSRLSAGTKPAFSNRGFAAFECRGS